MKKINKDKSLEKSLLNSVFISTICKQKKTSCMNDSRLIESHDSVFMYSFAQSKVDQRERGFTQKLRGIVARPKRTKN